MNTEQASKNIFMYKKSKYGFGVFSGCAFDSYLFQLIMRLNPYFKYCNKFELSPVDKVTIGT